MRRDKIRIGDDSNEMALTIDDWKVANPVGFGDYQGFKQSGVFMNSYGMRRHDRAHRGIVFFTFLDPFGHVMNNIAFSEHAYGAIILCYDLAGVTALFH